MISLFHDMITAAHKLQRIPDHWVMHPHIVTRLRRDLQRVHWSYVPGEDSNFLLGRPIREDAETIGIVLETR